MIQKPKIQYVGQFYVYGSEAKALDKKKEQRHPKTELPKARVQQSRTLTLDPVSLAAIASAVVLLVVMVLGTVQLSRDWQEYHQVQTYVSNLKMENAQLEETFRESYDMTQVQARAEAMGLIPVEQAETQGVRVRVPAPAPERTFWDDICWFFAGLFE